MCFLSSKIKVRVKNVLCFNEVSFSTSANEHHLHFKQSVFSFVFFLVSKELLRKRLFDVNSLKILNFKINEAYLVHFNVIKSF